MSEEQLKAFLEKVKADTSLQEKLKAAADSDAVLAIAKEAGVVISTHNLTMFQSEIQDAELEAAAGGFREKQVKRGSKKSSLKSKTRNHSLFDKTSSS